MEFIAVKEEELDITEHSTDDQDTMGLINQTWTIKTEPGHDAEHAKTTVDPIVTTVNIKHGESNPEKNLHIEIIHLTSKTRKRKQKDEEESSPTKSKIIQVPSFESVYVPEFTTESETEDIEYPYTCPLCSLKFRIGIDALDHIHNKMCHTTTVKPQLDQNPLNIESKTEPETEDGEYPYTCPICFLKFSNGIEALDHIQNRNCLKTTLNQQLVQNPLNMESTSNNLKPVLQKRPKPLHNFKYRPSRYAVKSYSGPCKQPKVYHPPAINTKSDVVSRNTGSSAYLSPDCSASTKINDHILKLYKTWQKLKRVYISYTEKHKQCPKCLLDQVDVYFCPFCLLTFTDSKNLYMHISMEKGSNPSPNLLLYTMNMYKVTLKCKTLFCILCDTYYWGNYEYNAHMHETRGNKDHNIYTNATCDCCTADFYTLCSKNKHQVTVNHFIEKYRCTHCRSVFMNEVSYLLHVKICSEASNKNLECINCGKVFMSYYDVKRHDEIHSGFIQHVKKTGVPVKHVTETEAMKRLILPKPKVSQTVSNNVTNQATNNEVNPTKESVEQDSNVSNESVNESNNLKQKPKKPRKTPHDHKTYTCFGPIRIPHLSTSGYIIKSSDKVCVPESKHVRTKPEKKKEIDYVVELKKVEKPKTYSYKKKTVPPEESVKPSNYSDLLPVKANIKDKSLGGCLVKGDNSKTNNTDPLENVSTTSTNCLSVDPSNSKGITLPSFGEDEANTSKICLPEDPSVINDITLPLFEDGTLFQHLISVSETMAHLTDVPNLDYVDIAQKLFKTLCKFISLNSQDSSVKGKLWKLFVCPFCFFVFSEQRAFNIHIGMTYFNTFIHQYMFSNQMRYLDCPICDESFRLPEFNLHMLCHINQMIQVKCYSCDTDFTQVCRFNAHICPNRQNKLFCVSCRFCKTSFSHLTFLVHFQQCQKFRIFS